MRIAMVGAAVIGCTCNDHRWRRDFHLMVAAAAEKKEKEFRGQGFHLHLAAENHLIKRDPGCSSIKSHEDKSTESYSHSRISFIK